MDGHQVGISRLALLHYIKFGVIIRIIRAHARRQQGRGGRIYCVPLPPQERDAVEAK